MKRRNSPMSNEITTHDDEDDGYSGSLVSGRVIKGQLLRWNETNGWLDRDGLRPPEIMLAIALSEALQCWKGRKPVETITAKPLPDVNMLNESVPEDEWEAGLDGKPKPPWVHQFIVYLIDPASDGTYTYMNSTTGARIACDQLREKVITMRALRGTRVVPVVRLTHRPMKTFVGMKHRPEFEVLDWRQLGGDGGGELTSPKSAQLTGPSTTTKVAPEPEHSANKTSKSESAAKETLASMQEVSRPTASEELRDEIPW
jgi:hypothetical protein